MLDALRVQSGFAPGGRGQARLRLASCDVPLAVQGAAVATKLSRLYQAPLMPTAFSFFRSVVRCNPS